MPAAKPNKHQARTKETRDLLLRAAETVFVRDGYAGAELGEIAALAGRTKGAIYAQFKSKQDIFLALIEEHALRYRQQMQRTLAESSDTAANRRAYRDFCVRLSNDQAWNLLLLEFKLFAIRNPEARQRLHNFLAEMISPDTEARLIELLGQPRPGDLSLSLAVRAVQPLLSCLDLEAVFDPGLFDPAARRRLTEHLIDALLHTGDGR